MFHAKVEAQNNENPIEIMAHVGKPEISLKNYWLNTICLWLFNKWKDSKNHLYKIHSDHYHQHIDTTY